MRCARVSAGRSPAAAPARDTARVTPPGPANAKQHEKTMNVAHGRTRSLWMDVTVAAAPSLDRDETADVAVVGSGIAGLSVAYELAARGADVVVLDRGDIGSGMTARSTAHLASAFDDGYAELIKTHGRDAARLVYRSQAAAIDRIEAIQTAEAIECDFARLDGYLVLAS